MRHGPDDDSVAQYVAGTMNAGELDEFEQHLLECEFCRNAVRTGAAARVALVEAARTQTPLWAGSRVRTWWLAAAAAAVVTTIILANRGDSIGPLGDITAAPFVAGAVRPAGDSITALVDSGMVAYTSSDFVTAASQLERASSVDSSASVAFFLGVSRLMNNDNRAALRALERAARAAPYASEAVYFQAKAFVRLGHPDSAIAVLERATAVAASPLITAFADSIRRR